MKIGLISCTKSKKNYSCQAKELYSESALFRYALAYCSQHYDRNYILSAKYGLVELDQKIEPYDKTLNTITKKEKQKWSQNVAEELKKISNKDDIFYFHAGKDYREFLIPLLESRIKIPLEGLKLGEQLRFYKINSEAE